MSEEFKPITFETKEAYQEAIDNVLKDRLNRQKEKHARELSELSEKYKNYDEVVQQNVEYAQKIDGLNTLLEEANNKVAGYDTQIKDRDEQISKYQMDIMKSNIATSYGLAPELAERLTGNTEDELREDAKKLSSIVGKSRKVAPLATETNNSELSGVAKAFRELNPNLEF